MNFIITNVQLTVWIQCAAGYCIRLYTFTIFQRLVPASEKQTLILQLPWGNELKTEVVVSHKLQGQQQFLTFIDAYWNILHVSVFALGWLLLLFCVILWGLFLAWFAFASISFTKHGGRVWD